ncbi:MAG: 2'-5' RNA ligase family protein [Cyclobacteriaceae bacterium]
MAKSEHILYFLAILPSESIRKEVTGIKEYFREKYQTKAALRSPAHITLHMPFRWKTKKEAILHDVLAEFALTVPVFDVQIDGYGSFAPRVIYLDIPDNPAMSRAQKTLVTTVRTRLNILNANYKDRAFRPHMTVAFRDLRKADFYAAWEDVKDKAIEYRFEANALTLLRNTGGKWDIYRNYPFSPGQK